MKTAARRPHHSGSRPGDPQQSLNKPMHTRRRRSRGEPGYGGAGTCGRIGTCSAGASACGQGSGRGQGSFCAQGTAKPAVIQVPVLADVPMPQAQSARQTRRRHRTSEHERVQDPRQDRRQDARKSSSRFRHKTGRKVRSGLAARRTPRAARRPRYFPDYSITANA